MIGGIISFSIYSFLEAKEDSLFKESTVSVTGRLRLEVLGKKETLLLYGTDEKAYIIKGNFTDLLKNILNELGENNLISVIGKTRSGFYDVSCRNRYKFEDDKRKVDTECIRYYHLLVTKIVDTQTSEEAVPAPKRDELEEARAFKSILELIRQEETEKIPIKTLEGEIKSINLKTPIKTIVVSYSDKEGKKKEKSLILTRNTKVGKKKLAVSKIEIVLDIYALKVGQKVYIEYLSDKNRSEALFITLLNE